MAQGQPDLSMVQDCSLEQLTQQLPMLAPVAAPAGLSSAAQLDQELFIVLEVGLHRTQICLVPYKTQHCLCSRVACCSRAPEISSRTAVQTDLQSAILPELRCGASFVLLD